MFGGVLKEKNSSLLKQNSNLERFYENVVNDKRELQKRADSLKREVEDTTKKMAQYAKQLKLKEEELRVERGRQTTARLDLACHCFVSLWIIAAERNALSVTLTTLMRAQFERNAL